MIAEAHAATRVAASVFSRAMGADFARLHPMLQRRFGVGLAAGYACVGRGTMTRIRRGPWWTIPFLQLGRFRNILVPETGADVPFTIENHPTAIRSVARPSHSSGDSGCRMPCAASTPR